jgi:DNA-binding CsgD family transcriptional regulator
MTKLNGKEVVTITPLEGAVALLAAKCRSLISSFASILDEDPQYIQGAVSEALAVQPSPRLAEDDVVQGELVEEGNRLYLQPSKKQRTSISKRTTPGHLSPTQINQIRTYKHNHTIMEVAERFNLNKSQANYALYGLKAKRPKARNTQGRPLNWRLTDAQLQEIKSRLIAGQHPEEIAQHMKINRSTIYKYRNQFAENIPVEQAKAATQTNT